MHIKQSLVLFSLLIALMCQPVMAGKLPEHTQKIAEDVYVYGDPSKGYYSLFLVTQDGVIAIESVNTQHAKGLANAITEVTSQPIRYLLHSHNHWDHAGGGKVFKDLGAKTLAHDEAYVWLKANPHKGVELPSESWKGARKDIALGGQTIELHYLGMNHGLGMTVFRLPKHNLVYIADLVTPKRVLFTIAPDFNIKETQRSLREIQNLDFDKAVFSHSPVGAVGSKQDVKDIHQFIDDLRAAIYMEFKKGTPAMKIPNKVRVAKYKDWAMYDEWLHLNAWRILLDGHMGPFPWHP